MSFLIAPVAQLDRVPGFEPGGREFESLRARHFGALKDLRTQKNRATHTSIIFWTSNQLILMKFIFFGIALA